MQHFIELLESRTLLAANLRFAVIGDFGEGNTAECQVAALVKGWKPTLVLTTGDDNYPSGAAATIDAHIGADYHQFIYPYKGSNGPGPADKANRFFPTLGNHDWLTDNAKPYLNYFALPGNERYYTFKQGLVQFFAIDSDPNEPSLNYVNAKTSTANSPEGQWLRKALAASTATWKIVYFHQPPFSSGTRHGSSKWMQWPFKAWGASAVLSGHEHNYERLIQDGLPYFVDGAGGSELYNDMQSPLPQSKVRYAADHGAMLVDATATSLQFRFITHTGKVIDTYSLTKPKKAAPVFSLRLIVSDL